MVFSITMLPSICQSECQKYTAKWITLFYQSSIWKAETCCVKLKSDDEGPNSSGSFAGERPARVELFN